MQETNVRGSVSAVINNRLEFEFYAESSDGKSRFNIICRPDDRKKKDDEYYKETEYIFLTESEALELADAIESGLIMNSLRRV